jgi:Secretion system C-terminal sorting domain
MKNYLLNLSIITLLFFGKGIAQNETIQWSVISSGSVITTSQNNVIESIAGQPIVDKTSDSNNDILTGFFSNPVDQSTNVTGINEKKPLVGKDFKLFQNYPNPFNPVTTINYSIPQPGYVSLKVYDELGRKVAILVDGNKEAGNYEVQFDGSALASGIYFYKIQAGNFQQVKKLILLK